jgi:hypothetical protein
MVQPRWLLASLLLLCGSLSWSQAFPFVQVFGGYSYAPTNFSFLGGAENG